MKLWKKFEVEKIMKTHFHYIPFHCRMSYEGSSTKTNRMLDSLNLQLREAEKRRADAERAHQVKPSPLFTLFHDSINRLS